MELLAKCWRIDTYATAADIEMSKEEQHAMKILRRTAKLQDNRYEIGLLWKQDAQLPNNYASALQQFKRMRLALDKDKEKLALYRGTINKDLEKL